MVRLKEILGMPEKREGLSAEEMPAIKEYTVSNTDNEGRVTYRARGFTRKHVPYCQNGKLVAELVSSIVTS